MTRRLAVTADDFGLGDETSLGILELAAAGLVTSTVLLVTSPHAERSVRMWAAAGRPVELGWHPCLTLDAPLRPAGQVPSLVGPDGRFLPLGGFLKRLLLGRVRQTELDAEMAAQLRRFAELTGGPPPSLNGHHHCHIFPPVWQAVRAALGEHRPFVRRVTERRRTLLRVPGGRLKRLALSLAGRRAVTPDFPGNDELIGVTDPEHVRHPDFFPRWLRHATGDAVEISVHPGHPDPAAARDADPGRRPAELAALLAPAFRDAVAAAGFTLVSTAGLSAGHGQ